MLDLDDIQGDVPIGLQKDFEDFIFFKILDKGAFKLALRRDVIGRITSARRAQQRELAIARRKRLGQTGRDPMPGLNLGFTKDGLTQLLGPRRPSFDPSFERGADHPDTIAALHDPRRSDWLKEFLGDRIDGVFLLTTHDRALLTFHRNQLLGFLSGSIKVVYSAMGNTRPGQERRKEHFGFRDGVSQPGIRGLTPPSRPSGAPMPTTTIDKTPRPSARSIDSLPAFTQIASMIPAVPWPPIDRRERSAASDTSAPAAIRTSRR